MSPSVWRFVCAGFPAGGDEEVRTPDPLRARQVLSQLSYTPVILKEPFVPSKSNNIKTYILFPCTDQK